MCSTVYGDLVCRGCKRYAHEVIEWNRYEPQQKREVWRRLVMLRDQAVQEYVEIVDEARLRRQVEARRIPRSDEDCAGSLAYALLWRAAGSMEELSACGLRARDPTLREPGALMRAIDAELYLRSEAHYERNFRTLLR